jgi:signal transduction histidine kinase
VRRDVPLPEHRHHLDRLSSQVEEIAGDLYDLSHKLHPSRLHTLGLVESVRVLCDDESQQRDVAITFSDADIPDLVDPSVSLCLYRITQEALHNVAKHSRSRDASVRLERNGDEILLVITDSGIGFDPAAVDHAGIGLASMRERVGILKGQLVIQAVPSGGTRIRVSVPLTPPVADSQLVPEPVSS